MMRGLPVHTAIVLLACLSLSAAAYHCASVMLLPSILSPISPELDAVFLSTHAMLCVGLIVFATCYKRKGWFQVCSVTKLVHYLAVVFVFLIAVVAEAMVQGRAKEVLGQPLIVGEIGVLVADGVVSGMLCYCGTKIVGSRKARNGTRHGGEQGVSCV
ncbi:hypothetical protein BCR44DRAFT_41121 [Catenaria anguillulae PL171]|uniref:Uncharacterized protein n=1 Tax=Catenaria anguillulae PL171 TaxID=765915 RepID=A0A1Y2HFT3_9FUNG|nr:hypothetical protein BCR44DRAFT_41121 [Catenaria anguillulae PL171]